jgi:nucleoid DNA-binding protein
MSQKGFRANAAVMLADAGLVRSAYAGRATVDMIFREVARLAARDGVVEIRDFGVFKLKKGRSRSMRLPDGRKVTITIRDRVCFKSSKRIFVTIQSRKRKPAAT